MANDLVESENQEEFFIWLIEDKLEKIKMYDKKAFAILLTQALIFAINLFSMIYMIIFSYILITNIIIVTLSIPILILALVTLLSYNLKNEIDLSKESLNSPTFKKNFKFYLEDYFFEINKKQIKKKKITDTLLILFAVQVFVMILTLLIATIMFLSLGRLEEFWLW